MKTDLSKLEKALLPITVVVVIVILILIAL
jgi:cell division protein FtsL